MSFFAFKRDADGNILVSDDAVAEWMEFIAKQAAMQTALMVEAFEIDPDTIKIERLEDGN